MKASYPIWDTIEELIGKSFSVVTTKEQKHEIMALFGDVYSGKIPLGVITVKHPLRNGEIKYMDHYISAMRNAGGEITGFHCVAIEGTDRVTGRGSPARERGKIPDFGRKIPHGAQCRRHRILRNRSEG